MGSFRRNGVGPSLYSHVFPHVRAHVLTPASSGEPPPPEVIPWSGYYTAAGITNEDAQTAIDAFGAGLESDGIASKIKVFALLGGQEAGAINVLQDAYHGSLIATPTFWQWLGVQGNAVDSYVDTGTELGDIPGLSVNSTMIGIMTNQADPGDGSFSGQYMVAESSAPEYRASVIYPAFNNVGELAASFPLNDDWGGSDSPATPFGDTHNTRLYSSRTGATTLKLFYADDEIGDDSVASVGFPTTPLFIAAYNSDGSPSFSTSDKNYATWAYVIAQGLSGAEIALLDARVATLRAALEALGSWDADAVQYCLYAGITDLTYINAINTFVKDLKTASLWTKFDRLWLLANQSETAALTDLKGLTVATAVNSPTFTAGQGFTFNGTSQYLDSGMALNGGTQYVQNSASFGAYVRAANGTTAQGPIGVMNADFSRRALLVFQDGTNFRAEVNNVDADALAAAHGGRTGLWQMNRSASNALQAYKNGASVDTGTQASGALTGATQTFFIGAVNTGGGPGSYFDGQLSIAFTGASFSGADAAAFDTCVDTLKTAIGF